jgi:NAD(P)-dependent dehydrogenase (short-subunit alcohol dehydrogenase family)
MKSKQPSHKAPLSARLSDAAEAAKLVALLSSEHAAYITGDVIRVDGGWYIPHPDTAWKITTATLFSQSWRPR